MVDTSKLKIVLPVTTLMVGIGLYQYIWQTNDIILLQPNNLTLQLPNINIGISCPLEVIPSYTKESVSTQLSSTHSHSSLRIEQPLFTIDKKIQDIESNMIQYLKREPIINRQELVIQDKNLHEVQKLLSEKQYSIKVYDDMMIQPLYASKNDYSSLDVSSSTEIEV